MAKILPNKFGLNPGPFNVSYFQHWRLQPSTTVSNRMSAFDFLQIKEHTMITIMAGVSAYSAYATDIIAVQRFFYQMDFGYGYQIMLYVFASSCKGAVADFRNLPPVSSPHR